MSFLSPEELSFAKARFGAARTPLVIASASKTEFARSCKAGAMRYRGVGYTYLPKTDEMIRDEVLKLVRARRRDLAKYKLVQPSPPEASTEPRLFQSENTPKREPLRSLGRGQ